MLDRSDLHLLSTWCETRAISWTPAAVDDGCASVMLEAQETRRPAAGRRSPAPRRMLLVIREDGFAILTDRGETLATASELTAVLDAVENIAGRRPPQRQAQQRRVEAMSGYVF